MESWFAGSMEEELMFGGAGGGGGLGMGGFAEEVMFAV